MTAPLYPSGKFVHHSQFSPTENTARPKQLFIYMVTELCEVLGEENDHPPPPGYEIAWRIFLGVTISEKTFFICHITEQCPAADTRYCEDFGMVGFPIFLCIQPFHIKSKEMELIQGKFPQYHRGHVPFQMALAITPKTPEQINRKQRSLSALLCKIENEIFTPNFCAVPMTPEGILSLSFKTKDFPLEICTAPRQTSAIFFAIQKKLNEKSPDIDSIILYQEACTLEMSFTKTEHEYEMNKNKLRLKNVEHHIVSDSVFVILNSPNLTDDIKQDLFQRKQEMLKKITDEIQILEGCCYANRISLLNQKIAVKNFKKKNSETLPPLYAETTFQITINMRLNDGSIIHKQFNNETKNFDLCEDPEKKISGREFMKILYQD